MAITAASTPALALLGASDRPMPVHSIYASGVNLRCGDYLIHASTEPHGGVSSLGVSARDVELLCREPAWQWTAEGLVGLDGRRVIHLDDALQQYPTSPPPSPALSAATPGRLERARTRTGQHSWFDSGPGRGVGLPRLRKAIRALVERPPDGLSHLVGIIGLGTGLTPSADDALVGALCLISAAGALPGEPVEDLRGWLGAEGVASTTDVSLSYLRLALEGEFSAPINRAVACLSDSSSQAELEESVRGLGAVGATSGMDTALGIQITCELLSLPTNHPDLQ